MVINMGRKAAIVGIGETKWYKAGGSPDSEFKMTCMAVKAAIDEAGLKVSDIDGFGSYADDRNTPARLAAAFGTEDLKYSNMHWGGGGGGGSGAIQMAAAAVILGYANYVVVYRGMAQGEFGRFGQSRTGAFAPFPAAYQQVYGQMSAAQTFAFRVNRFMHDNSISSDVLRSISRASYYHAQNNPRALMHGRPLSEEDYDNSRWIIEPYFHLFDCCQENDAAAAAIVTTAERARDLPNKPAYILAATHGSDHRQSATVQNFTELGSSNYKGAGRRLFEMAGVRPKDIDVLQSYENFTGGVLMAMCEAGFCKPKDANDFFKFENLKADGGKLPLNTSGGNLAECYAHGFELITEATRQIRGTSPNQVKDAKLSMVISGPMVVPVSSCILCD